jgi:myo-inositol-1(or 4)-monophosphatase
VPARPPVDRPQSDQLDLTAELVLAVDLARRAGAIQVEHYERLERVMRKGDRDVVTEVDHLCEELILAGIRERFPADGVLAEESGAHAAVEVAAAGAGAERLWIVDPLDGTVNYANGIPIFCVSIGLAVDGQAAVGVVYDPIRDELFGAVRGSGACLDDQRIVHEAKPALADCIVTLAVPRWRWRRREAAILKRVRVSRDIGSASLALAYVANGRFDAFIQVRGLSTWDVAAAGLIATEAGVTVTDGLGGPWLDPTVGSGKVSVVAAAPGHHAALLDLLA